MITVVSHEYFPAQGIERVILKDCHGRVKHVHVSVTEGHDIDAMIQKEKDEFAAQETQLSDHAIARFKRTPGGWLRDTTSDQK